LLFDLFPIHLTVLPRDPTRGWHQAPPDQNVTLVSNVPGGRKEKARITTLPCIGDGRQSGTSGSPSILNASPEAAAMGGLAYAKNDQGCMTPDGKRAVSTFVAALKATRKETRQAPSATM
jgi:hypothetical protein